MEIFLLLTFQHICFWGSMASPEVTVTCPIFTASRIPKVETFHQLELSSLQRTDCPGISCCFSDPPCSAVFHLCLSWSYLPFYLLFPISLLLPSVFFLCFFCLWFISNWGVLWRSVSSSTVTYSVANALFCAFPVLLHLQSLAPGTEAFQHSGSVQYLLQWDPLLLSNNMIDTASINKWFICTLRFLDQGDFSCNYSLLHEELKECSKYAINANIHKCKCPRLFVLRNMQVHSCVSPHVSGIMVCR